MAEHHKQPVLAGCPSCRHIWPILWMPMEINKAATVMQAGATMCPACGHVATTGQPVTMARPEERAAWHERHPAMAQEVPHA